MIAWVLVILFNGSGAGQATIVVPGIASESACALLGAQISRPIFEPVVRCYPYRQAGR